MTVIHDLWSSAIGWWGLTIVIVAACAAVGWYFPPLRRIAMEVAGVVLAATAIYTKGTRDEANRWSAAEKREIDKSNKARADAERAVTDDPSGVRDSKFDRDKR